ncbi:MAG: hypothetical protein ND866_00805 [Pyrinomonadaceae bacterium]|nr:hypothetical protein [Pyrinomonadaceae bacterium]
MEAIAGIFDSRADAERGVYGLRSAGIANDRVVFLTPGTTDEEVESSVPVTDTEQPGMGKALGGAVGGAIGLAGGGTLGAAVASLLVPGVGPVIAAGVVGAALLGVGGAATGAAAGAALERELAEGLSRDELYLYEDALRKGRSIVIAFAEDDDARERIHNVLAQADAESIDAARESWWVGLRDAEEEHYLAAGGDFRSDEVSYRLGFEAALNPKRRGRSYEETASELHQTYRVVAADEAFRRGYRRGQDYHKRVRESHKS